MTPNKLRELASEEYGVRLPSSSEKQLTLSDCSAEVPVPEPSYSQDWPLYEKACSREKLMVYRVLKAAVEQLSVKYDAKGVGRPPLYLADLVKSVCLKAYHNYSSWRMESELRIAKAMGVIDEVPKRSTLNKYMQDARVTAILKDLLHLIAEPLAQVETEFAADATGIKRSYGNTAWQKVRHTKEEAGKRREYVKLHIITGVKTNIITAAKITKGTVHESPHLPSLLEETKSQFTLKHVSADAGYLGRNNVKTIKRMGAKPWIKPKKNTHYNKVGRLSHWTGMLYIYEEHRDFFALHYNKRQNVEATFSALKRKFGDFCRCKKLETQENEILSKLVVFNAAILAESLLLYDLGSSELVRGL